jgi:hypothetical protein
MATTTSMTTTYAGEFAGRYISAALLSGDTIAKGGIEVIPNVKYKQVLKRVALNDIVKDQTCDFTDTSTLTLNEAILQPEFLQVNLELCKTDFESDWEAIQMGYSAFDTMPTNFVDYFIGYNAAKVSEWVESKIWTGVTANAGEFNGFQTILAADTTVIDVTAVTGGITAANVITEMGRVLDASPNAVYGKDDLYLYVPTNVFKAYVRALGGFGASGLGSNGVDNKGTTWFAGQDLFFDGVRLFHAPGMGSNKMVLAQKSNLYFGTGVLNDTNEVKILDMSDLDGSKNVRFVMRFTAGVQVGFGADVVLYA